MKYWNRFFGVASIVLVWIVITKTGIIRDLFLPEPWPVLQTLVQALVSDNLLFDLFSTLWRSISGFFLGSLIGFLIGMLMGYYRVIYDVLDLPIDFFRSIPATALFPLFIVIFGLGDLAKLFITAWAVSMVVLINTIYGFRNVSATMLRMAELKRVTVWDKFKLIILPSAVSSIVAGLRVGLSFALIVEIVAEMFLGSNNGLGHRIFNASSIFEMEEVYATIILVGILGYGLNKIILSAEKRIIHWLK